MYMLSLTVYSMLQYEVIAGTNIEICKPFGSLFVFWIFIAVIIRNFPPSLWCFDKANVV